MLRNGKGNNVLQINPVFLILPKKCVKRRLSKDLELYKNDSASVINDKAVVFLIKRFVYW